MGMCVVMVNGRMVRDPDRNQLANGMEVISFPIAVTRDRRTAAGEYLTDFFRVRCFGAQAKFVCEHFRKGDGICLRGRLQNDEYVNKDGVKVKVSEIYAEGVSFPDGRKADGNPAPAAASAPAVPEAGWTDVSISDGDLPF